MTNLMKRTHMCGDLRNSNIGETVELNGWIQKARDLGGLIFADLRDKKGLVQIVFKDDLPESILKEAASLRSEFVVGIKGNVGERESKNPDMETGDIEVIVQELNIYSKAETPPIYVKDDDVVDENLRLKYRYLDLRKPKMQRNLSVRAKIAKITRDYFSENDFTEVETPMLVNPTPEGARDYLVPSRVHQGSFYALPQSPQQYKQLLMAGGTDRYVQIVKCFRDEDLRADRQPEFTQVDLEMSFVDEDDIMKIQEGYLKRIFKEVLDVDITTPFPRLSYQESMDRFGSDKPDIRFGFELVDISEQVKDTEFKVFSGAVKKGGSVRGINIINAANQFSRKNIDKLTDECKAYGAKGLAWIKITDDGINSSFSKFFDDEQMKYLIDAFNGKVNDLILIVADKNPVVYDTLGFLRREVAGRLGLLNDEEYKFLWVVDFPLLEYNEEEKRYTAMHHPFTSPKQEDIDKMETDPGEVRARAYDIVLNGVELGGGSIRIHDRELQSRMFDVLGLSEEEVKNKFEFLLDAFRYGVPPHGGLAYGLDRLVMLILGESSIRETIAFPKNQAAECPVSRAPGHVTEEQLDELGLELKSK